MSQFDIRRYKSIDELLFHASIETKPNDLLAIRNFGRSTSLTANTPEDVWSNGGTRAIQTTAETISVVSDSASDAEEAIRLAVKVIYITAVAYTTYQVLGLIV